MTAPSTPQAPQPLVDLRGLAAGVLWRRRLWGFLAMLGILAGLVVTFVITPGATAVTKVLITRVDDTAAGQEALMQTDVALFNTTATAAEATRRLNLEVTPREFAETFEGKALTANVLLITAEAPTDAVATRRADTLADVFIAAHVDRVRSMAQAQSQALLDRRAELQRELSGASAAASASDEQSDRVIQRRADIAAQMTTLDEEAQQALVAVPRVEAGTRIVDPPRAVDTSLPVSAATNVAVGLVLGLAAGIALAAVLYVTRDRPVLRRDIAAQLGVPIAAELPVRRRTRLRPGGRGARVDKRVTDTLVRLVRGTPGRVSLLELGCPRTATAVHDEIADQLEGADPVGLGSVSPGTSWVELAELGSHTLLIVRAGHADTLWLRTVARRLAEVDVTPIGCVLVSPYPWDHTDGALWGQQPPAARSQTATKSRSASKKSEVEVP